MAGDYFYAPPEARSGQEILIEGEELQHLVHVMRHKEGDTLVVVDGTGVVYETALRRLDRRGARCEILTARREPPGRLVRLGVGVLKNPAKFDFLVEKATELGVSAIVPLRTARTLPERARVGRWQKLALAAMKQSGRAWLPLVAPLTDLAEFLAGPAPEGALRLCAHEEAATPVLEPLLRHGRSPVQVCVGPEGGFAPEEVRQAAGAGFLAVSLGGHRLRTETAAMVAAALCGLPPLPA